MDCVKILKTDISQTNLTEVSDILQNKNSISVAICNVNTLVRSYKNSKLQEKINSFDIKAPDGFPVAKASNLIYKNNQKRVDGFNVFHETINKGLEKNLSHYFFGNNKETTLLMIEKLKLKYPKINIVGYYCPPTKEYTELTDGIYTTDLENINPDVVWVSLGFPKQEEFILAFKEKSSLTSNFIGVGAVFEWVAGKKLKAPEQLANIGLEWIFRLAQEPRRLFKRYLVDNFLFIIYLARQLIKNN